MFIFKIIGVLSFLAFCPLGLAASIYMTEFFDKSLHIQLSKNPILFQIIWSFVNAGFIYLFYLRFKLPFVEFIFRRMSFIQSGYIVIGFLYYSGKYGTGDVRNLLVFCAVLVAIVLEVKLDYGPTFKD